MAQVAMKWGKAGERPTEAGLYVIYGSGGLSAIRIHDDGCIETIGTEVVLNMSIATFDNTRFAGPIPEPEE